MIQTNESCKICIITLGCKVNQYESSEIATELRKHGHQITEKLEKSDLYLINTCAITQFAEKKSRYEVSRILRRDPAARIIICGCASQLNAEQFNSQTDSLNIIKILGTDKKELSEFILNYLQNIKGNILPSEISTAKTRNRVFIKAQDGCNNFCSYCIVPYLRGRSRSRQTADIIQEIKSQHRNVKEIVLTGIDLSSYGLDIGTNLSELCVAVDNCGLAFRLSSIEVRIITSELLQTLKNCNSFCPSFHLPLQSGSDKVLMSMNRKYTTAEYFEKVNLIRKYFPEGQITTDIICGFPTETSEDAAETGQFIRKIDFLHAHIFPYSRRTGTKAASLPQLQPSIVTNRTQELISIQKSITNRILQSYVGKNLAVLIENEKNNWYTATSREYINIKIKNTKKLTFDWCNVKVTAVQEDVLIAEII